MRIQCVVAKKALGSVREMNMGGSVVVLGGDSRCAQNVETNKETRINYEQGQYVVCPWALVKEGEVAKEADQALKAIVFRYCPRRLRFIRI